MSEELYNWDEQIVEDSGTCDHDWQFVSLDFNGSMEATSISICMKCRLCRSVECGSHSTAGYWRMVSNPCGEKV